MSISQSSITAHRIGYSNRIFQFLFFPWMERFLYKPIIYGGGTPCTYQNSTTIKGLSDLNLDWSESRSSRASLAMYDRSLSTKGERITLNRV